jgi:hypothetical protein
MSATSRSRPVPQSDSETDEAFAAFARGLNLAPAYNKAGARSVLGKSDSAIDRLVRGGQLPAYRIGTQQLTFLGVDLARVLWRARVHPTPLPAPQKTMIKQTPPRPRGRPRSSPVRRVPKKP